MSDDRLYSDAALSDPGEDELGYEEFAADLAGLIQSDVPQNGFVVSVNGPWGSGKSTILNFLEAELSDGDDSPTIVRFNPWWFSGEADLTQRYLEELGAALGEGEQYSELREKLATYANAVSKVPLNAAGVPVNRLAGGAARLIKPEGPTTDELKSSIETTLEDEYDHIVVFIDEIDRLTNRETSQVFKLVKSVADFPNTTYVLAFSREIVTDALQADQNPHRVEDGDAYLDKIVQLPRSVPVPRRGGLRIMLEKGLEPIAPAGDRLDDDRASRIIDDVWRLLDTPREVTRLLNSVRSSHSMVEGEVNFVDLVALEALKKHAESVYESIKAEPASFALLAHDRDPSIGLADELNEVNSKRGPVRSLVSELFPHWDEEGFVMSERTALQYRKADRVAHPDRLFRYFRKTVPEDQHSGLTVNSIIQASDDEAEFTERLREELLDPDRSPLDNRSLLAEIVASRRELIDPEVVLRGVFDIADDVIEFDNRVHTTFATPSRDYLLYLYRYAGNELDNNPTDQIISAIRDGDSLYFPVYLLAVEGDDRAESDIRYCPRTPHEDDMSQDIVDEAKAKRQKNALADVPRLCVVVDSLAKYDQSFVSDWLEEVVRDEERLPRALAGFTRSFRKDGEPVYYIDPLEIGEYVDLDVVQTHVSALDPAELTMQEQRSMEKFERGMELIDQDRDPGEHKNWSPT